MAAASALQAVITKADAVARIDQHLASWLVRFVGRTGGALTTIELVHLPFWIYAFRARRSGAELQWTGCLAIETRRRGTAILPATAEMVTVPSGATLLPAMPPPSDDHVRRVLLWEALAHRRRDRPDSVVLDPPTLLFVPFWLGYLKGRTWDLCPVDATTGKIDLSAKDALLDALGEAESINPS